MASEVIKLNLIPKGEMPVFHASQFDTGRLITCELYRGEDAYSVPEGYTVELHCRKVDNNIVTMASTLINDNVVTFTSTEQLTACNGKNLCEVAILDEGYRIGTLNFILEVEVDPLKGGINSTSEIHNLETQIEEITTEIVPEIVPEIVTEIVGENYYNKTEVDDLLDTKADASSVYTKTQVDALIDNIFPTLTASGSIASFTTALTKPLVSVTADEGATTITRCGVNLFDKDGGNVINAYMSTKIEALATCRTVFAKCKPSTQYTISKTAGQRFIVAYTKETPDINVDIYGSVQDATASHISTTTGADAKYIVAMVYNGNVDSGTADEMLASVQIAEGTDTTYHSYTGNTVPVADATTLVTEAGINNVFADSGNVTVQYKYMSI